MDVHDVPDLVEIIMDAMGYKQIMMNFECSNEWLVIANIFSTNHKHS